MSNFEELNTKGKYKELLIEAESNLSTYEAKYWKLTAMFRLGNFNEALDYGLSLIDEFEAAEPKWRASLMNNIGVIYSMTGELDLGFPYLTESLKIRLQIGDKHTIASSHNNLGALYQQKGNLDKAMEHYLESLEIHKKTESKSDISRILNNIGNCYYLKGELNKALEYHSESLKLRELVGNPSEIAMSLSNLGLTHLLLGNHESAMDFHTQSLDLRTKSGTIYEITNSLMNLIYACLKQNQIQNANSYFNTLKEKSEEVEDKTIKQRVNYSKALILKASKRNKDKVKAQEIFEEIVETNDYEFGMLIESLHHLIELLIYEYKSYEEEEVLHEIMEYTEKMSTIAKAQNLFSTLINVLILQSRLAIIQNDFDKALKSLEDALEIASNNELGSQIKQVMSEKSQFTKDLTELKHVITSSSAANQLEKTAILDYLEKVLLSVQSF